MAAPTLLVSAAVQLAAGASFALVGRAVWRRSSSAGDLGHEGGAVVAFALWWWALAAYLAVQSLLYIVAVATAPSLSAYLVTRLLAIPLLCLGSGALTYYILYLLTGRAGLRTVVAALYSFVMAVFAYGTIVGARGGLDVTPWIIQLHAEGAAKEAFTLVYFLVGLPPILGSAALLVVAARTRSKEHRYRGMLVGLGILSYVGSGLAAFLGSSDAMKLAALTGSGLLAGLFVLAAYYPPRVLRRALGVSLSAGEAEEAARLRAARGEGFRRRLRDLV
jgi:hypothetical protein